MFLDDALLQIGRSIDLSDEKEIDSGLMEMYKACQTNALEKIGNFRDDDTIRSCFDRTNWIWNDVRNTLFNEGIKIMALDGFKNVVTDHGSGMLFTQKP